MNNNQKSYFHIGGGTATDQTFALLDTVQSDNEDDTDILMIYSDMEFLSPEEIELTVDPGNASIVTPEANVYIADKGTTHTKELRTNKKKKKLEENTPHMETQRRGELSAVIAQLMSNCL